MHSNIIERVEKSVPECNDRDGSKVIRARMLALAIVVVFLLLFRRNFPTCNGHSLMHFALSLFNYLVWQWFYSWIFPSPSLPSPGPICVWALCYMVITLLGTKLTPRGLANDHHLELQSSMHPSWEQSDVSIFHLGRWRSKINSRLQIEPLWGTILWGYREDPAWVL